ncbi:MAG TPA: COX15/CtaA family protein [Nannocystaceae bacterium]|nr:COX15/CtaA family protein [Nannocystaceae bacterium]
MKSTQPFRLAIATLIATWILLLIGGTVNPMGASMACPDWYFVPTCNGELLPEMTGGVLYEHGHRLWASWVGLLTVVLAIQIWRAKTDATTRNLGFLALFLVCFQGVLGGVTVKLNLHSGVSTLHLATAMLFFGTLVLLCFRLAPASATAAKVSRRRGLVAAVLVVAFFQVILGGMVRHLGAGLICGDDWIGCGPSSWTKQPLAHLHMTHRIVAYALVPLVVLAAQRVRVEARATGNALAAKLAMWPAILVLVQVVLGLVTVATGRSVAVVTFHTGVGALVLASLWACVLALGPAGARIGAAKDDHG